MELEDYLYRAECNLAWDAAGAAAQRQYPNSKELQELIGKARVALREVYIWLEANTSRQCP